MQTRKIALPLMEKRHTVYCGCGRLSTPAKQAMQGMVDGTSEVETCGGLYVGASDWQDAPTGPPVLNRTDRKISLPICVLDMIGNRVGFMAGP